MPDQITEQERLFGVKEVSYGEVTVSNGDLYPFLQLVNALVDECKLRHDGDVFSVTAVDKSNVAMASVELDVATDLQTEFTIGLNSKRVGNLLQNKPRSDDAVDVTLDLAYPHSTLAVENEYANGTVWNLTERFGLIDPDSIREEPDLPELDLTCQADLSVATLRQFIASRPSTNPIKFEPTDDGLRIGQINSVSDSGAEYDGVMKTTDVSVDGNGSSIYTYSYLADIVTALGSVGVETATVRWGDEYPIQIGFTTDSISGEYMMAPRVKKE